MYTRNRRPGTGDVIWYTAFGAYLILAVLQASFFKGYLPKENRMNAVLLVLLILLVMREWAYETMDPESWLLLGACGILTVNAFLTGTLWSAFPWLLLFFGRHIPLQSLFTFAACVLLSLLLLVILSAEAGLIENYKRVEANRENHREYLGFLYALYPGSYYFMFAALLLMVRRRVVHFLTLALLLAGNYWIFLKTDGRLSFYLTCVLVLCFLIEKLFPDLYPKLRSLFALIIPAFPLSGVGSVLLTLRFNASVRWMNRLDNALTHRLTYGQRSIEKFGIGLLGRPVSWVGYGLNEQGLANTGDYLYVDNAYVNFLQRYGLIAFCTVLLLGTCALCHMYAMRRYGLMLVFLLLMIHGLLDDRILYLSYNLWWIAAARYLRRPFPAHARKEAFPYADIL